MARRRQIYDVVGAILSSFLGRNNDVDGYWALGQLRSFADAQGTDEIRLDLLGGDTAEKSDVVSCVTANYQALLEQHLMKRTLPREWLRSAEVVLVFGSFVASREPLYITRGDPMTCTVSIVDDRGRTYERSKSAYCAPHNPRWEQRR